MLVISTLGQGVARTPEAQGHPLPRDEFKTVKNAARSPTASGPMGGGGEAGSG